MALTSQSERKSLYRMLNNESGQTVLALSASYEERVVLFQIERINPQYCTEHADDVQQAVSAFIAEANAAFKAEGYPQLM